MSSSPSAFPSTFSSSSIAPTTAPTTTTTSGSSVLSNAKYIPLLIVGNLSCLLSVVGSSCVIYMLIQSRLISQKILYRLLLGLSIADWIASFSGLLMPYLVPASFVDLPGASGTTATCTTTGFFYLTFASVGCCYNTWLSIYYLLVVRHGWKERDFATSQFHIRETLAHLVAATIPTSISLAAVSTQSLNPAPLFNNVCIYAAMPWGCGDGNEEMEDVECQRSSKSITDAFFIITAIWEGSLSVVSFFSTLLVWRKVRRTIKRSSSYRFEGMDETSNTERLNQVGTQAILYSAAYFNTFIWPMVALAITHTTTIQTLEEGKEKIGYYIMALLFWTLYPLQGALNFFIFTRLKVQQWKKVEPNKSIFWIYQKILASKEPPRISNSRGSATTPNNNARNNIINNIHINNDGNTKDFARCSGSSHQIKPFTDANSRYDNESDDDDDDDDDDGLIE